MDPARYTDLLPFKTDQDANERTRKFLHGVISICLDYIERENRRSEKVIEFYQPEEIMRMFDFSIPDSPSELDQLVEDCRQTLAFQVRTGHPHFFNQLSNGLDIVSLAGEWLTAAANTNMFTYEIAPVFILMEHFVLEKMRQIIGFTDGDSILAPGGAISNLYSLIVARHKMFPECKNKGMRALPKQLVLFTSEHSHYSSKGAGATCGFGTDNVVEVPCDERGRMRPDELERLIVGRLQAGDRPFYVNCTCGTTVLGAFDPVNPIADICAKYDLWLHIDAAWGGGCLLSDKLRHKLNGIERANSVTWNPHKLMGCVLQCSTVHFREKNLLMSCNQMCADYLFQQDKQYDVSFDTGDKVIQCGRHNDIFKLWLMWRAKGTSGYAKHMEHLFEMTRSQANQTLSMDVRTTTQSDLQDSTIPTSLIGRKNSNLTMTNNLRWMLSAKFVYCDTTDSYQVEKIKQGGDKFHLIWPEPECTNVCFWYVPCRLRGQPRTSEWEKELGKITAELKSRMMYAGTLMIGYQPLGTMPNFFRSIISSSAVQRQDIDFMLDELDRLGQDL